MKKTTTKYLTVLTLSGFLLVGCGTDKETNANEPELQESTAAEPELQESTSSIVEEKKDVNVQPVEITFIGSLDSEDIMYADGFNIPDSVLLPEYNMYGDMMIELAELFESDYDTEKEYDLVPDDNAYSFTPQAKLEPLVPSEALIITDFDARNAIESYGTISVSSKESTNGSQIYTNNQAYENGEPTYGDVGDTTYVLYENDDVFVYITNSLIDRTSDENPAGDDLKAIFTSDEATAIYEEYIK